MKKFIIAMVVLLVVGVVFCVIGAAIIGGSGGFSAEKITYTSKSWTSDTPFHELKLSFNSARNLKIVAGEEYKIDYADSSVTDLTFSVADGVLTVQESRYNDSWVSWFRGRGEATDFIVTIPANERVSIDCKTNGALTANLPVREEGNYGALRFEINGAANLTTDGGQFESLNAEVNGACNLNFKGEIDRITMEVNGAFNAAINAIVDEVDLEVNGACNLTATDLTCRSFKIDVAGATNLTLSGRGDSMDLDVSGSCKVNAESFDLRVLNADVSGSGNMKVSVSERISIDANASFTLRYRGNPQMHVNGKVKLEKLN